jgi:RimJ/RimL family protein N-acetyltransferase
VDKLFVLDKPDQILFSVLEKDTLIGYGGLVHIDWDSRNGEISLITDTARGGDQFRLDWVAYLILLKQVADELRFEKIFTYGYDVRPLLFQALKESSFEQEARLKNHILIKGELRDVMIHSLFLQEIEFRTASQADALLYFNWANDDTVRRNAFSTGKIEWEHHKVWFEKKTNTENCLMLVASLTGKDIGQIRFDEVTTGTFEIGYSLDKEFRGRGLGSKLLKMGAMELFKRKPAADRVVGKVKEMNEASKKAFDAAGFDHFKDNENKEIDIYILNRPA